MYRDNHERQKGSFGALPATKLFLPTPFWRGMLEIFKLMNLNNDILSESLHRRYELDSTVTSLFLEQLRACPNRIAVIQDGLFVTYAQLAEHAAAIALSLRQMGVVRGDRVGLHAVRGHETVAAQLGVMALGAAFVPLDPGAPFQVNRTIVAESTPTAILSTPRDMTAAQELAPKDCPVVALVDRPGANFAALVDEPSARVGPNDLAYVIYTSGSTGRPKGVMVAHRGVCRLVRGQDYADLGPDQVMLNMAAVGFDACIGEIYSAILNGGTLAILSDPAPSLDRIGQVIARDRVTIAYITAGLFHVIAEHRPEILAPLAQVFPCGDVLSPTHVQAIRRALPHLRMINGYGPTENTVFTCCYPIEDGWTGGPIPIGRGLAHDRLFVLDEDLQLQSDGQIGQLAVGGAGVGLGYLGRPDLTEASFITLETADFVGKVYLTGDLVTRGPDGIVRFHGRADRQIKINGQRVELDAVEHALRVDPTVEDAVAVALQRPDNSRQIVAFVIASSPVVADFIDALGKRMRAKLPAPAVPTRIIQTESFPLSNSGKVDRKRLAAEFAAAETVTAPTGAPLSVREVILRTWSDVLGRLVEDDGCTFFDLGGTSLQIISVHAQLQQRLGIQFDIAKLFEAPRIGDLERLICNHDAHVRNDPVADARAAMSRARRRKWSVA